MNHAGKMGRLWTTNGHYDVALEHHVFAVENKSHNISVKTGLEFIVVKKYDMIHS